MKQPDSWVEMDVYSGTDDVEIHTVDIAQLDSTGRCNRFVFIGRGRTKNSAIKAGIRRLKKLTKELEEML